MHITPKGPAAAGDSGGQTRRECIVAGSTCLSRRNHRCLVVHEAMDIVTIIIRICAILISISIFAIIIPLLVLIQSLTRKRHLRDARVPSLVDWDRACWMS